MTFLLGLASGLVFFVLLGASYYMGYRRNKPTQKEKVKPQSEDERRKIERMQKGFDQMMSYSVEKARGSKVE